MTEPEQGAWDQAAEVAAVQLRGSVVRILVGLVAGLGVAVGWWVYMGPTGVARPPVALGLAGLSGGLLLVALALQVVRTAVLFPQVTWAALARPVVVGHGANALFATAGDLVEVVMLARLTGRSPADILLQLLYRASTTAAVAIAAVLVAAGPPGIALALAGLAAVVVLGVLGTPAVPILGYTLPRIVPVGGGRALALVAVTLAQLAAVTGSVALAIAAVGGTPHVGAMARAAGSIDLLSYVPVPLANVGLHHLGMTWSPGSEPPNAWGATLHHVITLGVGALALVGGWLFPTYGWGRRG